MTVWRKFENEECYAVAIYNFAGGNPSQLTLDVGELVHLEGETEEWYWGTSVRREASGAFPKTYVEVRDCYVERCGETVVASAGGAGVAHDIATTLREWVQHLKRLYIDRANEEKFNFMEVSMLALLELRAQVVSGALPQDQLRRVARTAVFTIQRGNRQLGMELTVRNASGQLVDPLSTSTYKFNAMHDEANARIEKNMETTPATPPPPSIPANARTYTLALRVNNFVCRMSDSAELLLCLHDTVGNRLTENLLIRWPQQSLMSQQLVFTDLPSDIKKEKVFLVCHVVRIGSMEPQITDHRRSSVAQPPPQTSTCRMRRPFGVACSDITRIITSDVIKEIQLPFYPCEKENLDSLLKKVMANRDLKDTKNHQGLWVTLQLVEGDLKQIREENAHLVVGNIVIARKMGFPEVILPGLARNDLYVTLVAGSFSKGSKSSDRNIEVAARVVDKHGQTLQDVISVGAGGGLVDEYTSLVYYHDDKPRWQEVFKVCLNIELFKEAHIVFLFRHRSSNEAKDRAEKHFAMSYLRLMQKEGTTIPDNTHALAVYKIDMKRATNPDIPVETEAAATCLAMPARRDELPAGSERGLTRGVLALVHRDVLNVSTKLCSTKLTQREEILGVLKWSTQHAEGGLKAALRRLLSVPGPELVKFLQDILDALFSILTEVEEDRKSYSEDSYGVLVLDCLLCVISLVADHKYQHFQPVLQLYIERSFCDAAVYENLISVIIWVIRMADNGETALKRLLTCMKCVESLMRIIVRSRQLRSVLGDVATDRYFKTHFEDLLEALVWLMRCGDYALTCQGSALKYLPHAVPHIIKVYPDAELSAFFVRALGALSMCKLSKQRMLALLELLRGPLCTNAAARATLLPHLAHTVKSLLKDKAEWDRSAAHQSRSVDKAARLLGADTARLQQHTHRQQILELCIEALGEVMALLARDDVGPVDADRGELARCLLPTVLHTATSMLRERSGDNTEFTDDAILRRIVCVLLDMVRQMSEEQYNLLVKALEAEKAGGSGSLVSDALALLHSLLQRPVFRPYWADMLHLQHYVMLHALRLLSITLRDRLQSVDMSDSESVTNIHLILRQWFSAVSALATSQYLQLETLTVARRHRIVTLYTDLRRGAASAFHDMWFALGEHRRAFIPCLVGPLLEVSLLLDEEVWNTTIPLFFDMMQTEYTHSVLAGLTDGNLRDLESELIDKLDVLIERGLGSAAWRARFVKLCGALCGAAGAGLRAAGGALVAAAARQLDTLLRYREAARRSATPHRMLLTTQVLDFYRQIDRPHMYIRYVHKLARMHHDAQQWAEAGLSLRLHAKLLQWTHEPLPPRLRHPTLESQHSTQRELKEFLYLEIAELLNRGRQWEVAVEIVKELVSVYEEEALGYGPLAELHSQLAGLYEAMLRKPRYHPSYFRVIYYGNGFPKHLREEHGFVYRGNEFEQLADFKERLLDEWPDAEVLTKLDTPGEDITQSDKQYLQINTVDPLLSDKLKRLSDKPVSEQVLSYYKYNSVDKFVFSRPFHKPDESTNGSSDDLSQNEFATRWLERTELEISERLPGILKWFRVVSHRKYWVSPLEGAVEALRDFNRTLRALVLSSRAPDVPLQPLTMRLNGILDPAVQGGLANYEQAFLTNAYAERHPDHAPLLDALRSLIRDQIPLLKSGLDVHGARASPELLKLHEHMLYCFKKMKQHVQQRYGLKMVDVEPEMPEVQLRMRTPNTRDNATSDPNTSNNRISDISTGNDTSRTKFFSAINPLVSRNSSSGVASYFGTLQSTPRKRDKRRGRKSEIGTPASGSQWYTSHSTPNGAVTSFSNTPASPPETPASASPLRELSQQLVPERTPRIEAERERRLSQRASLLASQPPSNRDSMGTTDSNQDDEEPPPLPEKLSHRSMDLDGDNNNNGDSNPLPARNNYDMVFPPTRGSFLYNSIATRRHANINATLQTEKPPTPPPKKKNIQNNNI
ncbi:dedicator of cytokinesis protein 1 isoform X3 [Plodia interpunctella]|uniref:dedicator of cytokinesis protein 1 isoform X3 n=1 Tax=Plodia interpunctella TaxID=58824 RepID=UPI0023680AC0|nr:dedicator of cytokinesis protein 1 isoform X3 [Plodia interpunctella]